MLVGQELAAVNSMSDEPPSLAPLVITPDLAAQARAAAQAAPAAPPPAPPTTPPPAPGSEGVETLAAMFPTYEKEILSIILADHDNNVEAAIEQLLQMGEGGGGVGGGGGGGGGGDVDLDEELAFALMQQFAADLEAELGEEIPADVRSDPARYDAFVQERFAAALQGNQDSALARRANSLVDSSSAAQQRGGKAGFLERLRNRTKGAARPLMKTTSTVRAVPSLHQPAALGPPGGPARVPCQMRAHIR